MSGHRVVLVGAGAAGTAAATELRRLGFEGPLTLLNGEDAVPYNRTTVNKTLLQPGARIDSVRTVVPDDPRTTVLAARAEGLDVERRVITLHGGRHLGYDALLIATGARPRALPLPPAAETSRLDGRVTGLRTDSDAERIRRVLSSVDTVDGRPARVAIAGGSLLGSETADALHSLGHEVFLIDTVADPLRRLLGTTIAAWVDARHRESLAARIGASVVSLEAAGNGVRLVLSNGTELTVDLLIEALGVTPDVDWLRGSALVLDDGVVVDDHLRAVDVPGVYAAGDLARVRGSARVEHWGHALAGGQHAARAIAYDLQLGDDPGPFRPTGSYSTWLYGKGINVLGTPRQHDREVALASTTSGGQVAVYTGDGSRISAAVVLGSGKLANRLRPLVMAGADINEAADVVTATLQPVTSRT